jgi:hypothetical protein
MLRRALAGGFALVLIPTIAAGQDRPPRVATPPAPKAGSVVQTDVLAEAAQRRQDEQQKAWDRKMKAATGGVCTGC